MDDSTREMAAPVPPFGAPNVFVLAVVQGTRPNDVHRLTAAETVIGRGEEAAFRVEDEEVSKRHLVIYVTGSVASVVDLHSKNGTRVNTKTLEPGVRERLRHLDEIQIGGTRLLFLQARFRGDTQP
jgi:pSer/pThr/pTyr-binding forkhead associated (FHA) protein